MSEPNSNMNVRKNKSIMLVAICTIVMISAAFLIANMFFSSNSQDYSKNYIGEEQAKIITLQDAGISESQLSFDRVYLDQDDRRVVYDIEFHNGNIEYNYEIDDVTGSILEKDTDIKD